MAKSSTKRAAFAGTVLLAAAAVGMFLAGEMLIMTRTDAGRLAAARYLHLGDPARVTEILGRHIRSSLNEAGVPSDSIRETVLDSGSPRLRWVVGLRPRASTLQANYAITRAIESQGGAVLSGVESVVAGGVQTVTMRVGLPGRTTHEIVLRRPAELSGPRVAAEAAGRLCLVLYGFVGDAHSVVEIMGLPQPFAIAIPAGQSWSASAFHAAREKQREVVLHLPLEPLNYPQMNPGPGAILVTMGRSKIEGTLRHYLDQSGPVAAVANLMGSLATQDQTVMTGVYDVLRERRTPFMHMSPAPGSVCRSLASQMGVAYDEPDAVIDAEARRGGKPLDAAWNDALSRARRRGQAVVMLRATEVSLAWLPGAMSPKRLGSVEIVPLASIVHRPPSP